MADDEKELLLAHLAGARRHALAAVHGLSEEQMRQAPLPSDWAPVEAIHHLALDDERFWLRAVVGGDEDAQSALSDNAWIVPMELGVGEVLELYRREAELGDAAIRACDLDARPAWWPGFMGKQFLASNRAVVLHLLTETAAHAGQLDAARELIDGKQWVVLTS